MLPRHTRPASPETQTNHHVPKQGGQSSLLPQAASAQTLPGTPRGGKGGKSTSPKGGGTTTQNALCPCAEAPSRLPDSRPPYRVRVGVEVVEGQGAEDEARQQRRRALPFHARRGERRQWPHAGPHSDTPRPERAWRRRLLLSGKRAGGRPAEGVVRLRAAGKEPQAGRLPSPFGIRWTSEQIQDELKKQKISAKLYSPTGIMQRGEITLKEAIASQRREGFEFSDVFYFSKKGLEAIVEDQVTQRFTSEEPLFWNLLTRTSVNYQYLNWKLTLVWFFGALFRYAFLLPFRFTLFVLVLFVMSSGTLVLTSLPNRRIRFCLGSWLICLSARLGLKAVAIVRYHNKENRPLNGSICVANHTTPMDIVPLMCNEHYSLVGQAHGGMIGFFLGLFVKTTRHIFFDRSEMKHRSAVRKRLTEHTADKTNAPILIFPEGTCINNTSVMMFKKGTFEIETTIYPVAIKYDRLYSDPYWNSSKYTMTKYGFLLASSWAFVCDVWYLPPMHKKENEDAIQFANRVQSAIAAQAGLTSLPWDGALKRQKVKDSLKQQQQEEYCRVIVGKESRLCSQGLLSRQTETDGSSV
ncbi:glycerol-3-phosphate acyltransferase 3-like [Paroedura picta]|uniref:glycerol-3-phosphate acyltransferase 3-like n=1 Tax=Paroedura picta TaxID=143630 RepID=UPI0040572F35